MKLCTACNARNDDTAVRCGDCDAPLETSRRKAMQRTQQERQFTRCATPACKQPAVVGTLCVECDSNERARQMRSTDPFGLNQRAGESHTAWLDRLAAFRREKLATMGRFRTSEQWDAWAADLVARADAGEKVYALPLERAREWIAKRGRAGVAVGGGSSPVEPPTVPAVVPTVPTVDRETGEIIDDPMSAVEFDREAEIAALIAAEGGNARGARGGEMLTTEAEDAELAAELGAEPILAPVETVQTVASSRQDAPESTQRVKVRDTQPEPIFDPF